MTHGDYLQNAELCKIVRNPEFIHFFCGRTILSFDPRWLADQPKVQAQLRALEQEQRSNPLRFYAPNSQEQLDFLNDTDGTSCALVDLNRSGKTTAAWIKMLVGQHPMIKADPTWEIFADHGVDYHEFRGAISVGVATYTGVSTRSAAIAMLRTGDTTSLSSWLNLRQCWGSTRMRWIRATTKVVR